MSIQKLYLFFNCSNEDIPPALPPHGIPAAELDNQKYNNSEEYRPPVPPHRNIGVSTRPMSSNIRVSIMFINK